jgi:hypothetical protein
MITRGTILIKKDTVRPACFQVEDHSYPNGWMLVKHNLTFHELERELTTKGWTFFFMANAIRTMAFGFNRSKMTHAALTRLIRSVELQNCNCLQIEDMATRSFLGIPYVSILAHPRHIQKGMVFGTNNTRGASLMPVSAT